MKVKILSFNSSHSYSEYFISRSDLSNGIISSVTLHVITCNLFCFSFGSFFLCVF